MTFHEFLLAVTVGSACGLVVGFGTIGLSKAADRMINLYEHYMDFLRYGKDGAV